MYGNDKSNFCDYYFNNYFCAVESGYITYCDAEKRGITIDYMIQSGEISTLECALEKWNESRRRAACPDDMEWCDAVISEITGAM